MSRQYVVTKQAIRDLDEIKTFLVTTYGPRAALSLTKKLRDALSFLASTPCAGHLREDLTNKALKFRPVSSYLVIYNPSTKPLQIARVVHASRDVSRMLMQGASIVNRSH